jgi:transposase
VHERQVKLGLHVTSDCSLPVAYELLSGNGQQQPRAKPLLHKLQDRLQRQDLTLVTDRGGISYDIIADYQQAGAHFVSCLQLTPALRQQMAAVPQAEFEESTHRSRRYPNHRFFVYPTVLEYTHQKRSGPLAVKALIVHSERKQESDAQQRQEQIERAWAKLQDTREKLNRNRLVKGDYVRRLLKPKVPGALADMVRYELRGPDGALELTMWVDEQARAEAAKLDGRYMLLYDLPAQIGAEEAFKLYKRQYLVESRFRNFRTDLAVNPVWLQRDDRIAGLVLVYILALTLLCLLGLGADRAGLEGDHYPRMSPQAMLRRFTHLQAVLIQARGQPAQVQIELTPEQSEVLRALNLPDPERYVLCTNQT